MKAVLLPVLIPLLLAAGPAARAADLTVAANETENAALTGNDSIELTDFSGGVGSVDAKDGANSMISKMMQPNATSAPGTASAGSSRYVYVAPTAR